jgi:hypothetical protein
VEDRRLERLYDYTKFHIGIYLSAGGVIVTLLGSDKAAWLISCLVGNRNLLWASLIFVLLAGIAGGVIASSLASSENFTDFWEKPQGPLCFGWFRGQYWTWVEHLAFWISIGCFAFSLLSGIDSKNCRQGSNPSNTTAPSEK